MSANLDLISPTFIGGDKIVLSIAPESEPLLAQQSVIINFDYSQTQPYGIVLPLELKVQPAFGRGAGYFSKIFRRVAPSSYAFQAPSAGLYLAVLKECGHNFWQGRLLFDVAGEEFSQIQSTRQQ